MATYRFSSDACDDEIEADTLDAAAVEYARDEGIRGVRTAADLTRHIERVGGWIEITDEAGQVLASAES